MRRECCDSRILKVLHDFGGFLHWRRVVRHVGPTRPKLCPELAVAPHLIREPCRHHTRNEFEVSCHRSQPVCLRE